MIRMLLTVAMFISIGLLTKPSVPSHINNQVASKPTAQTVVATPQVINDETVTPVVTSTVPTCDSYDALLIANFGSENLITAKAIMRAESGCRHDAVGDGHITYVQNGTTYGMSCGLFQIRMLPGRPPCSDMQDASKNIAYAASMFNKQGWHPWSAFLNGAYKKFL